MVLYNYPLLSNSPTVRVQHLKVEIDLHTEADDADVSSRWSNIGRRDDSDHEGKYSIPVCSADAAGVINNE